MTQAATSPLRLLIIDDHQLVGAGLRMLVEDAGLSVVGMARNRTEALELAAREKPDLVLLDLDLAGEDGLSLLPELKDAAGNSRVLVLTGIRDPEAHRRAVKLGAMGVVLKDQAAEVLIKAIRKVCEGEVWLDRATMGNLLAEMTRKSSEAGPDDAIHIKRKVPGIDAPNSGREGLAYARLCAAFLCPGAKVRGLAVSNQPVDMEVERTLVFSLLGH